MWAGFGLLWQHVCAATVLSDRDSSAGFAEQVRLSVAKAPHTGGFTGVSGPQWGVVGGQISCLRTAPKPPYVASL